MANQEWIDANDIGYNLLKPNAFKLSFHNIPKVSYFCQTANIPGLAASNATQQTPFIDIPISGDKLVREDLNVTFLIDSRLENYTEIYNWMAGINFPNSNTEFIEWRESGKNKTYSRNLTSLNEESGLYTDATLLVLSAKNNPQILITYEDIFPVTLSGLPFDSAITDINYFTASATFKYKTYKIEIL